MAKIIVLPIDLANQIAAGEVVERPSSVVKELVENSIDADAKTITIRIENAGRTKIVIEDDGIGMDREDAIRAFERHATSKIKSTFDLFRIRTLGFRGEALPSIASVSKLNLQTSTGASVGTQIEIIDGKLTASNSSARQGTIVTIEELFYNTPARLKYLSKDYLENSRTIEAAQRLALAHPHISFHLFIDDRNVFSTSGRGDVHEVIYSIFGAVIASNMKPFKVEGVDFDIEGFLGTPAIAKSSRYFIITLLNGRAVYMPKVNQAIIEGYRDFIPDSRYPFVVLNFKVDFSLVDVNVHPSKKEVRFSKEDELRNVLISQIPLTLSKNVLTAPAAQPRYVEPIATSKDEEVEQLRLELHNYYSEQKSGTQELKISDIVKDEAVVFSNEERIEKPIQAGKLELRAIAQIHHTYIIADDGEYGFYLVDQHAANERINYEDFQRTLDNDLITREPLAAFFVELTPQESLRLTEDKQALLHQVGVRIEHFGGSSYRVSEVPVWRLQYDEKSFVEDAIQQVLEFGVMDLQKLRSHAIATMACKASVRAHDYLSIEAMQYLLDQLMKCDNPYACPHGRPTIVHFTKYDIEKMFKRTGV